MKVNDSHKLSQPKVVSDEDSEVIKEILRVVEELKQLGYSTITETSCAAKPLDFRKALIERALKQKKITASFVHEMLIYDNIHTADMFSERSYKITQILETYWV